MTGRKATSRQRKTGKASKKPRASKPKVEEHSGPPQIRKPKKGRTRHRCPACFYEQLLHPESEYRWCPVCPWPRYEDKGYVVCGSANGGQPEMEPVARMFRTAAFAAIDLAGDEMATGLADAESRLVRAREALERVVRDYDYCDCDGPDQCVRCQCRAALASVGEDRDLGCGPEEGEGAK